MSPLQIPLMAPGIKAGITEATIREVVHAFYAEVRRDPALAPIFNRAIGGAWDAHLVRMCDFWSSVLLMTGRFKGTPMRVHAGIPGLRATHFARWLQLFRLTVTRLCTAEAAALFIRKADMIGRSLQLGIAAVHNQSPAGKAPPDVT